MKNKAAEMLGEFLKKLCADARFEAENFRLLADYSESISLGQKENELLGPYNMPSISKSLSATLYIRWRDKKVSTVYLNYDNIANFEEHIAGWREKSFLDESSAEIWYEEGFDNADIQNYKMRDEHIVETLSGRADVFFNAIKTINEGLRDAAKLIGVNAFASMTRRMMFLGPEAAKPVYDFEFTAAGIAFELDNTYSDMFVKRRLFNGNDLAKMISKAKKYYPLFSKPLPREENVLKPSQKTVVLAPSVAESFIKKYVLSNLSGRAVFEKQSRFSLEEFRAQEKHFRDDISIKFSPDFDEYEINNIPITNEGVYAAPVYFVKNGHLRTPMLDLKYSKKSEMPPTAYLSSDVFQSSDFTLKIETGEYECAENVITDMTEGYIIFDVLGMHTQDHTSGDFSISAPHCLYVLDGKIQGIVKLSISGNIFETLKHHNTKFLNWYSEGDSIEMKCQCV